MKTVGAQKTAPCRRRCAWTVQRPARARGSVRAAPCVISPSLWSPGVCGAHFDFTASRRVRHGREEDKPRDTRVGVSP